MTPNRRDDQLAGLASELAADSTMARPGWVGNDEWARVNELASIERELRLSTAAAPPLHLDKTAAFLGLVPDPASQLDPRQVKTARNRAGLKPTAVAEQLTARGWDIAARDIFRWENQPGTDTPPALIEAIAAVLGTRCDDLVRAHSTSPAGLSEENPAVQKLVERFATVSRLDWMAAFTRLNAVAAASVHRGERPRDDDLLHRLDLYVTAMEERRGS